MRTISLILFMGIALLACDSDDGERSCFSFDIRQCQTDQFSNDVPESDNQAQREEKMKLWLESKGYDVEEVKLEINFHDAVCEACDVCPQGDRYFIQKTDASNEVHPDSLRLLNFESFDCNERF